MDRQIATHVPYGATLVTLSTCGQSETPHLLLVQNEGR
jgi:hypothetical protein